MEKGFICEHCRAPVSTNRFIGTSHRNHCPFCLWSKHVDEKISGDRKSRCHGMMKPIGLAFKKSGELMLVHLCQRCGKESRNRIAGDDDPKIILTISEEKDKEEIEKQLFGKNWRRGQDRKRKKYFFSPAATPQIRLLLAFFCPFCP